MGHRLWRNARIFEVIHIMENWFARTLFAVKAVSWSEIGSSVKSHVSVSSVNGAGLKAKGRFTLYVTLPSRRGISPFSKMFSYVIKRRCLHWRERLRHASVRSVAVGERECLTWRNGSGPACTCSSPIMWTVLRHLRYTSSVCLQRVLPVFVYRNWWKINRIGA
jgi:hypothetical protein